MIAGRVGIGATIRAETISSGSNDVATGYYHHLRTLIGPSCCVVFDRQFYCSSIMSFNYELFTLITHQRHHHW